MLLYNNVNALISSLKEHEQKINTWKGNSTGNTDKKSAITEQINQEGLKRYRERVKQYRQNWTFQNNERKFYQQIGVDSEKT